VRCTLAVVVDESREDRVKDLAATGLVGVGRDQRVLRFAAVRGDDTAGVVALVAPITSGAASEHQGARGDDRCGPKANASHLQFSSCASESTPGPERTRAPDAAVSPDGGTASGACGFSATFTCPRLRG